MQKFPKSIYVVFDDSNNSENLSAFKDLRIAVDDGETATEVAEYKLVGTSKYRKEVVTA